MTLRSLGFALAAAVAPLPASAQDAAPAAKNIIIMIADGWGFNHILCADYYATGEAGTAPYAGMTAAALSTYAGGGKGGYDPAQSGDYDYLKKMANDSAATATALASGVATYPGAIGVDLDKKPVELITERAKRMGKNAGVVSSVLFNHATPASFSAHVDSRGSYGDIAKYMIFESELDVVMGAGHPHFDGDGKAVEPVEGDPALDVEGSYGRYGGTEVWKALTGGTAGKDVDGDGELDAWTFIDSKKAFQDLAAGDTPKRVFGVAPVEATLQSERSGDVMAAAFAVPFTETVPTLTEMSLAALNVMDNNPKGFVLMIEGGAVDWACHANFPGRMVEEMIDYNATVKTVMDWVEANSSWDETLLVVTGDHECGYVLGPGSNPALNPIVNNGKGQMPGFEFHSKSHTNTLIPAFLKGPGADRLLAEYIEGDDPNRGPYAHNASVGKLFFELLK